MKISDLNRLDWRQDKDLLTIERKVSGLSDLESQSRTRLEELQRVVCDAEDGLVQARVARMLNETSDEKEEAIHARLSAARREIADLQADIEATKLAKERLEPLVAVAASEARLRVACQLLQPYKETAESLRAVLSKAVELNQLARAIHDHVVSYNLSGEIVGNESLRPLTQLVAWGALSDASGRPGGQYEYWRDNVDKIFR